MSDQSEDSSSSTNGDEDLSTIPSSPPDIVKTRRKSFSSDHEQQNGNDEEEVTETTTGLGNLEGEAVVEPAGVISDPSFVEEAERDLDESPSPLPMDPAALLLHEDVLPPIDMSDDFHFNTQAEDKQEELK